MQASGRTDRQAHLSQCLSAAAGGFDACHIDAHREVCVLHLKGEIDLAAVCDLDAVLRDAASGGRSIICSLRGVTYLDCAAIRVLERTSADVRRAGRLLVLAEPLPLIRTILEVVGLSIPVLPTPDAAWRFLETDPEAQFPRLVTSRA